MLLNKTCTDEFTCLWYLQETLKISTIRPIAKGLVKQLPLKANEVGKSFQGIAVVYFVSVIFYCESLSVVTVSAY